MTGVDTLADVVLSRSGRASDRLVAAQPDLDGLLEQFPPRSRPSSWPATELSRGQVLARLLAAPFAFEHVDYQASARRGVCDVLDWLGSLPGRTWQDRWVASGAEHHTDWRRLPGRRRARPGDSGAGRTWAENECSVGLTLLICADVIRPNLDWLLVTPAPKNLAAAMARTRDPAAFADLTAACQALAAGQTTRHTALARVAMIMAAKGGLVEAITVGDCIQIEQAAVDAQRRTGRHRSFRSPLFYQLLRRRGGFPASAPSTTRAFVVNGQLGVEELVDRYRIECRPMRDLLVGYLREFLAGSDYSTVDTLSYVLCKLFWRDLELHHPGIGSLHLSAEVAAAWKQRIRTKTTTTTTADGQTVQTQTPRVNAVSHLGTVRSLYLDLAHWAADDPSRWGPWVAPCPIRPGELNHRKHATNRKSRMDQRTRERLPALPALVAAVEARRTQAAQRLDAVRSAQPGQRVTVGGQQLTRPKLVNDSGSRVWADDATGKRRDLVAEERCAFWAWAAVEVLRLTGIRIEELTELSHHSLIQYRHPSTRQLVPLLQIAPSKTDTERLLVISPELADVLATTITRVRNADGAVPVIAAYDYHEKVWNPPMPLLFQWRCGLEDRPLSPSAIRRFLDLALAATGLTDPAGAPVRFTPHDFRRLFLTDAVMHGMPPHIAQLVAGHRDINTTMGYTTVYPEEVINSHRAFIARRRSQRPGEEYRTPTDEEWQQFLGHFERRRVALGDCGRSYATPCIHEHSCLRCPLLRPAPAQRSRILDIHDNLLARIGEAEREGWVGEVEGLRVSLAAAQHKLAQLDQMAHRAATVPLGIPTFRDIAGRTSTSQEQP